MVLGDLSLGLEELVILPGLRKNPSGLESVRARASKLSLSVFDRRGDLLGFTQVEARLSSFPR